MLCALIMAGGKGTRFGLYQQKKILKTIFKFSWKRIHDSNDSESTKRNHSNGANFSLLLIRNINH